jgi:cell division protein FtsQ
LSATLEHGAGAGVAVDPRIAERRRSVEWERRRRRRRRLLVVLVVLALGVGAWLLTRSAVLDVDSTTVEGATNTAEQDIVTASGVAVGEPLLDVDGGSAASGIEQLPWIDTATVSRSLDGVVTIEVTERIPVATVADQAGGRHLVDVSGRVLGPVVADSAGLTALEGVTAGAAGETIEGADGALQAWAALSPGVRSRVIAVVVVPDGTLQLRLNPQGVVLWGPPTELAEKAASLATVMGQVEQRNLASIDVSDPADPRFRRNP